MLTLHLPMPPSANRLWRTTRKGKVYINPKYAAWQLEAGREYMTQKRGLGSAVKGNFHVFITLDETKRKRVKDADNRIKPVLDILQKWGLIENDSLADRVCVSWGPVDGCSVTAYPSSAPSSQIENILWG